MSNTRNTNPARKSARTTSLLAATALAGATLVTPAFIAAEPAAAVDAEPSVCEVEEATLEWGTIERFRSYISGSIASGEWTTDGNVEYETPTFTWSEGVGESAADGSTAHVEFEGAVNFSGHGGLLQVNLENPTLEIVSADEAYLLLDLSSTNTSGEADVSVEQERAVELELDGTFAAEGDTLTFTEIPGTLTEEGAAAFGGFYAEGEPVDPITVTLPNCVVAEPVAEPEPEATPGADEENAEEPTAEAEDVTAEPSPAEIPWMPIAIAGAALLVIAVAVTLLIAGRRRDGVDERAEDAETDQP